MGWADPHIVELKAGKEVTFQKVTLWFLKSIVEIW